MFSTENGLGAQYQKARAFVDSLDDEVLMRLAWRLQASSLLDISWILSNGVPAQYTPGAPADNGNISRPPLVGWPMKQTSPQKKIEDLPPMKIALLAGATGTTVRALPVGPVPPGTSFALQSSTSTSQSSTSFQAELAIVRETTTMDGPTTIVIRNLLATCNGTNKTRHWLDIAGYHGTYDFLIYLARKQQGKSSGGGYAVVNFHRPEEAMMFMEKLDGTVIEGVGGPLNIVVSKTQGLNNCIDHFRSLTDTGRSVAWTEPVETAAVSTAQVHKSFQ